MQYIKIDLIPDKYYKSYVFENIYYEIQNIIDILEINNDLYHIIHNIVLKIKIKWIFLYIIFYIEIISSTVINLIKFIKFITIKTKSDITFASMKIWNRKKKWVQLNVITAIPLINASEEYLLKYFIKNNRKFYLEKKVNNNIMGGLILSIEDKEWNNSLEEKIRKLRIHLKHKI